MDIKKGIQIGKKVITGYKNMFGRLENVLENGHTEKVIEDIVEKAQEISETESFQKVSALLKKAFEDTNEEFENAVNDDDEE